MACGSGRDAWLDRVDGRLGLRRIKLPCCPPEEESVQYRTEPAELALFIKTPWKRWALAAGIFAAATALNFMLQPLVEGRVPLLPYFPAVVLAGLTCGLGPALAVLLGSIAAILAFWVPIDLQGESSTRDAFIVSVFIVSGSLVALVSSWARALLQRDRDNRERLNLALTAGRMASWDWDLASGKVTFSDGASSVFGRGWAQIEQAWPMAHPDDAGRVKEAVEEALRQGSQYSIVSRMYRPDNQELRWIKTDGYVHRNGSGKAVRVSGVTVDVTELQLALEASQAAEERFSLALESGKGMAWECNAEGRFTWVYNTPPGFTPSELVGKPVETAMPDPVFRQAVHSAFQTGRPSSVQIRVHHGDQTEYYLCSMRPVAESDGSVHRVLGATLDVTELKASQEQLRRENERKDTFLATLAHELRNPIAPIRYAVALLKRQTPLETKEQATEVIARQSSHIARLLDDLMDMSRITRNVIELKREVLDLRTVVKHSIEEGEPHYADMKQRVSVSLPSEPVWVDGDATRLQQVFGNLLDNAAKYSDRPGEVHVRVDTQNTSALVTVTDSGIGIPKERQSEVFQLFSQLHGGHRGRHGLGIGLAVVKQLVDLHGGSIAVYSEGTGKGSRFTVALPLARPVSSGEQPSLARVESPHPSQDRVLVVDDNCDAANALAALLQASGYMTSVVYDGESALRAFEAVRPHVVLLDLGLPGMSGLEVARALRREERRGPERTTLIAITGWGQAKDREKTMAAGFDAHLVKPVDPEVLEATLNEFRLATPGTKTAARAPKV